MLDVFCFLSRSAFNSSHPAILCDQEAEMLPQWGPLTSCSNCVQLVEGREEGEAVDHRVGTQWVPSACSPGFLPVASQGSAPSLHGSPWLLLPFAIFSEFLSVDAGLGYFCSPWKILNSAGILTNVPALLSCWKE